MYGSTPSGSMGRLLQEGDFMEKETAIYVEELYEVL